MTPDILNQHLAKTLSRGRVAATAPAGCPDISLYLFDPAVLEGPISHDEAQAVVADPAYWSFCWASGQVLAGYILANPHVVRGETVLDFGSGSGIVAIAAAMAGAQEAIACDTDPAALDAAAANARLNGVKVSLCDDWSARPDCIGVVTAADVLYDPENHPLLSVFRRAAPRVLLADSRMRDLGDAHYREQVVIQARTWPDLHEFEEFNRVRIYSAGEGQPDK
ncbi:50S ribosomal protein L11 methyltransferase [Marinobacter orientalis]|uniref:Methyltransferase domain-containing protein n=1 Tax=Marinobacter orientalis TaxID=1928859 RepID=A0A7Y0RA60_9GAMM|nr:50S ribosomal protein L11 methyltransferase [Marinobacter orientalis]NMT62504.1 methyltransferase domain-containing protein [Marinobacter orientalis]TGX51199.1 methyltransferase domain-containing protein [Marinobacter orientalis]